MTSTDLPPPRRRGPLPTFSTYWDRQPDTEYLRTNSHADASERRAATDAQRAKWRADYAANREKRLATQKAYRQRNPELVRWRKRQARRRRRAILDEQQMGSAD